MHSPSALFLATQSDLLLFPAKSWSASMFGLLAFGWALNKRSTTCTANIQWHWILQDIELMKGDPLLWSRLLQGLQRRLPSEKLMWENITLSHKPEDATLRFMTILTPFSKSLRFVRKWESVWGFSHKSLSLIDKSRYCYVDVSFIYNRLHTVEYSRNCYGHQLQNVQVCPFRSSIISMMCSSTGVIIIDDVFVIIFPLA